MAKSRIRLFNQDRTAKPPAADSAAAPDRVVAKDRSALFNQLALLMLIVTPAVLACYLLIFLVPQIPLNPFRPIAVVQPLIITPRATLTPTLTSTPTRTPRPINTPTETPISTATAAPTVISTVALTVTVKPGSPRTPIAELPTATVVVGPPTATRSPFNYTAELNYQKAQLVYTANWQGIAGLVFDPQLKHQPNILVHAWGDLPLAEAGQDVLSGVFDRYGPSGWEFTLGDKLASGKWHVQLVDDSGKPLSDIVDVIMQGDPRANLAFIIFRQNH